MDEASPSLTAIDRIADGDGLQMMKAAIPYFPGTLQKFFSIYVKMMEMNNLISYFDHPVRACSASAADTDEILQDIRPYCTESQKRSLDQAAGLLNTIKMYQEFQKLS